MKKMKVSFMSLNLPPTSSVSNISVSDDNDSIHHHQHHHYNDSSSSNFTSSLGVKKDFVLSPLTRITKEIQNKLDKHSRQPIDLGQIGVPPPSPPPTQRSYEQTRSNIIEI